MGRKLGLVSVLVALFALSSVLFRESMASKAPPARLVRALASRLSACPPPGQPSSFWGYLTVGGEPAPAGVRLAARINGVEVASTITQEYEGVTYYLIDVPERAIDDSTGEVCR